MAENEPQDASLNAQPAPADSGGGKLKGLLILAAGIILLAAGGGYGAAMLLGNSSASSEETPAAHGEAAPKERSEKKEGEKSEKKEGEKKEGEKSEKGKEGKEGARLDEGAEYGYYEFEPIIVNLDEPRLARYIRVSITLVIKAENHEAAKTILDRRKPELKNWLTTYFASCTLDNVRGAPSLNRLRREILDAFSQQLWPNQKPLIEQVLFKEFAVQ